MILTFYNISKNEECTFYRYDLKFVNGIPYDAQLTIVNKFVFLAFQYLTYNNSSVNFIKEGLKMVQQYRN